MGRPKLSDEERKRRKLVSRKKYYYANRDKCIERVKDRVHRNKESRAIWRKAYRDTDEYREYSRLQTTKRNRRIKERTPPWADIVGIKAFYENVPEGMSIDHIIPLVGENISGLHVLGNLQYITLHDNIMKGNNVCLDTLNGFVSKWTK